MDQDISIAYGHVLIMQELQHEIKGFFFFIYLFFWVITEQYHPIAIVLFTS